MTRSSRTSDRAVADSTARLRAESEAVAVFVLLVEDGGAMRRIVLPHEGTATLGRGEAVDLKLCEVSVSREHARVTGGNPPRIEDLGSTNGTRVMRRALCPGESAELTPGTVVELGALTGVVHVVRANAAHSPFVPETVVLRDAKMRAIYAHADVLAAGSVPVLILGETGVGKEVYAAHLHARSPRARRPFVQVNCAALPETILESELFGHEKGAFTGAFVAKAGLFEAADGGTLMLDEVGELSPPAQAKLLRVLDSGEVMRIGSLRARKVDVRVIAATNRDLTVMVEQGTFRADIYYRLAGVEVVIPPLRERPDDLEALSRAFLSAACDAVARPRPSFTPAAVEALRKHRWPGNVRELRNVIRCALLHSDGTVVDASHLKLRVAAPGAGARAPSNPTPPSMPAVALPAPPDLGFYEQRRKQEREAILVALEHSDGNQSRAAALLQMPRRTLVKRLGEYGISGPRKVR